VATRTKAASEVKFTHPEKVFFPKTGFTKGQLIRYYSDVAETLLPHLKKPARHPDRFPDGVAERSFTRRTRPRFAPFPDQDFFSFRRRREEGEIDTILIKTTSRTLAWLRPILGRRSS